MRHEEEQQELEYLREIRDILRKILHLETPRLSASLTFGGQVATILVGKTANSQWQEWSGTNGTGDKLSPAGPVTYVSSDTTKATVDPNTGVVTGVALGSATITGTDSVNNLTASDTINVIETAQSATLTLVAN